ncbi:MAG: TIGR00725 family protein [Nitrospirae bacterium CG2_30_70_394]|nr:MAG: TIGR00725 family protein [Nitrospirae bacterium CG2_30_70_394]
MAPHPSTPVRRVAVVGAAVCDEDEARVAEEVGMAIAGRGWSLFTGGLGGVMEAASRGAREAGGRVVGILPGPDPREANPYVEIPIATNMGDARNVILVQSVDGVVAVGGRFGTLSEIAIAAKLGRPVVGLRTWEIDGVEAVASPAAAIALLAGEEMAAPRPTLRAPEPSAEPSAAAGDPLRHRLATLAASMPSGDGEAVTAAIARFDGSEAAFLAIVRMLGRHHDYLGPGALHQLAELHRLFAAQTKG